MSKLAFRAQTVDIAYLPLRQDLFAKNVLMTAQSNFHLGTSLLIIYSSLQILNQDVIPATLSISKKIADDSSCHTLSLMNSFHAKTVDYC
jgi:hypothetical protein